MPTATQSSDQQPDGAFYQLIQAVNSFLAQSPGTNFTDIDPGPLVKLMQDYHSESKDWSKYACRDKSQCFTRNLVDRGSGKHNILILVWTPGKESPIHDHAGSHCIMKMLQGSLKETQYDWPNKDLVEAGKTSPLMSQGATVLSQDEVTYIADSHGLHKISNLHPTEFAVSLHLYTPPNAAKHGCQVFDEKSGKATHVVQYDLFSDVGHAATRVHISALDTYCNLLLVCAQGKATVSRTPDTTAQHEITLGSAPKDIEMSDVAPASPKPEETGYHESRGGPGKQLQVPLAASDIESSHQSSTIGKINGLAHHSNGDANVDKSDSEAETVVLSGKEEGQDHKSGKAINLEETHRSESDANRQPKDLAVVHEGQREASRADGIRQPSLKRKRAVPEHGHVNDHDSGNSSNLSSTVSSPAPQARSSKTTDSNSNRSRSSPPFDDPAEGRGLMARKPSVEKDNSHGYRRGAKNDQVSEPVSGRKRRDTRSATHYDEPNRRSESPPSRNSNRARSIQSNHPHSGVSKRRKIPAPLHVERRRKVSEDTHPESDDDSLVYSHRHLHKVTLAEHNAMSPAKMVSHKKNRDRSGQTLLARACRSGDVIEVEKWLQERPEDLDVPDYAENTPLQIAALEGNTDVVEVLLIAGCDTNCRNIDKETPLIDAVENGHLEVVKLLLKAGLDPRQTNAKGQEPLDLVKPDLDDAEEIREALRASKKEKALLRRPSEDHNRQQGTGTRDVDMSSGAASGASPVVSSRSPPPVGPTAKRRTARSQVTDDALLWVNATPARLRDAAGKGEGKIVDHILKMRPQADTESILAAARGGHEDVLGLMLAIATTDSDPEPLRSGDYNPAYSTPMLAAIGRGNTNIINLLLSQAGFDPTRRRYKGMTYYEIAKERQGADWQEEHDILKEAYETYRQHGGRKSNNNSPRRVRAKRADSSKSTSEPSSSPHEARKTRKPATLKQESSEETSREHTHKPVMLKQADETRIQSPPALASDHEPGRGLPKPKAKEGKASVEKSLMTPKRADSLKPKRRLMSGNDFKTDQDMKRRASHAADAEAPMRKSGALINDSRQRRFSDASESTAVITPEEASNAKGEMGRKRHRMSVSPQASKLDFVGNFDQKQKKRQRVDSHDNAIDQDRDRSFRPGAPAMVANMVVGPPGPVLPIISQGTAPVAFMGSNVASPVAKSPTDPLTHSAIISPVNSIDQALSNGLDHESQPAEQRFEEDKDKQERMGQAFRHEALEADERAIQEEDEKRRRIEVEKERAAQAEREAMERKARIARQAEEAHLEEQRQAERREMERKARIARQAEEAHLEEQRQAAEAERQSRLEREQEEARVARVKRDEELHQRRIEQERSRKEEQERRRREMEEREILRRKKLQEDEERQRLQSLPSGLRRAAELGPDDARARKEINKWLPLCTVETQELDPGCEPTMAEERWIANIQAAPILAIKDLDLSQYTAWTRFAATMDHRGSLWRQLRKTMSQAVPDPLHTDTEVTTLDVETRPKFFNLSNVFWIKLSDFMDIVPRHQHLAGLQLRTRPIMLHEHPFGEGGAWDGHVGAKGPVKQEVTSPIINGNMTNGFR